MDPLEQAIEVALDPGSFISYKATWSFVDDVQEVVTTIEELVEKEPGRAARLFETFIAACHLKADEIDDSSGNFGLLVGDLFQGWIRARQAGGADPEATAQMLVAWMDDDPYGFCYHLDREASKVLDRKGLGPLVDQIRLRYEACRAAGDESEGTPAYARRRWCDALKTVLAAAGDIEAFTALCEQTELRDEDCKTIAEIYRRRRRPEDALSWVERGLEISESGGEYSSAEHDLRDLTSCRARPRWWNRRFWSAPRRAGQGDDIWPNTVNGIARGQFSATRQRRRSTGSLKTSSSKASGPADSNTEWDQCGATPTSGS